MKSVLIGCASAVAMTASASAHVIMEKWEANAGYQTFLTLVVPHGCGASPTTEVRVKVPEGIDIIVPEPKAGWELTMTKRKLDPPIRGEGGRMVTEVVDEITWKGGSLPTEHLGKFNMLARMPDTPGKVMFFKTIQKCPDGETRWVDTVADGEPVWTTWANPAPAPFVELKAAPAPQLGASMQQIAEERKKKGGGAGPQ
ncbi:MAG: YcnI family protein [Rhodospirillaceae bacterium]|nr:YcnI family protein [Rhodospirillaceae bacterium]